MNGRIMRELGILGFCAVIALVVVWSLLRAMRTGRISSRGWTFQVDENPGGFFFVAFCDVLILAGAFGSRCIRSDGLATCASS